VTGADVARELARRFRAGDRNGARALMHPDIVVTQPATLPHGGVHRGHDGLDRMGAAFAEHWDRSIADARILDAGPVVVQVTTQTWTARATGRSATVDVVELITVARGLVTDIRVFPQDTHLLLGLLDG
jgi:ketosteroid isomerase-like protein